MLKRLFDILSASIVLLLCLPFLIIISCLIAIESRGGVLFSQIRVGKNGNEFNLYKLRSMKVNTEKSGQLTVGADARITKVGKFIRKFKIDELPQLLNVISGHMSVVGPRPEVPKYVALYTEEQRKVLSVRPGLTDYASIEYINESDELGKSDNPEKTYIEEVMPAKLALNLKYVEEKSFGNDLKLIFKTLGKIVF